MENIGGMMRGIYRDVLLNVDRQVVYDSGWVSNTIVDQGRSLLAAFMKGEPNASGIQYMAFGKGSDEWDTKTEPPDPHATNLRTPYDYHIVFKPEDILYLVEQDNSTKPSPVPTRRLEIKATLNPYLPLAETCPLREFGLFGKIGNQNFMINSVRHPLIQKVSSDTLVRVVQLYF